MAVPTCRVPLWDRRLGTILENLLGTTQGDPHWGPPCGNPLEEPF